MRNFALIGTLVVLALPAPVLAADWVLVGEYTQFGQYYIDRQSIRMMPNGYKRAWEQIIYAQPDKFRDTSSKGFIEYDCNSGRTRSLALRFFKGNEVTTILDTPRDWKYVTPESFGEKPFNFVCYGKL
jgi:hypothetical protein